jgi:hypothetical protein
MKVIIYAVISVLLLYLYYIKRDLSIFAAFIVVVLEMVRTTTRQGGVILEKRWNEGFKMGGDGDGGGDGIDSKCKKLGFSKPSISEKSLVADLEKEMKKIKKVADKHWPYDDWMGTTTDKEKQEYFVPITKAMQEVAKENTKDAEDQKKENELTTRMQDIMVMLYDMASSDSKKATDMKDAWDSEFKDMTSTKKKELSKTLKDFIKMIDKQVKMFTDASKTDIMKEASKEPKQVLEYLICLFTQWKLIFTAVNAALEKGAGKEKKEEE